MTGASSWSFGEHDAKRISDILDDFLAQSSARTALIVDKTGQMVATVGETPNFDSTAFASLTAADFSASVSPPAKGPLDPSDTRRSAFNCAKTTKPPQRPVHVGCGGGT